MVSAISGSSNTIVSSSSSSSTGSTDSASAIAAKISAKQAETAAVQAAEKAEKQPAAAEDDAPHLLSGESDMIGTANFDEDTPFGDRTARV